MVSLILQRRINGRVKVMSVGLDPIEVDFALMQVRVNEQMDAVLKVQVVDQVGQFVSMGGFERRVTGEAFTRLQVENVVVDIKDLVLIVLLTATLLNKVVPNLYNCVVEVYVATI